MSREELAKGMAARLRVARRAADISQREAAEHLGVLRPIISHMETGRRRLLAEELVILAELYGVAVAWVVGGAVTRNPHVGTAGHLCSA